MSRKIIGITVGTPLPKPNFDQTDPSKGDYIRGDRSFLKSVRTINGMSPDANGDVSIELDATLTQSGVAADAKAVSDAINALIGDTPVADQINTAISNNEATEDEIMELLASLDMFPVITDTDGSILTDENDAILLV